MNNLSIRTLVVAVVVGVMSIGIMTTSALSHHSFAMYDQTQQKTVTGKLTRYIPGSNHAQLIFALLNPDGSDVMENGRAVQWGVETGSAASLARSGVTVDSFPLGTIITVTLNPLRDGRTFGAMTNTAGRLISCGMTMPEGGCTIETGEVFLGED
jgi:hypothetical protein